MFSPQGSTNAHGNELLIGTNCLGPWLRLNLLEPILAKTAATWPKGSVRVTWAGSSEIDILSPKNRMELENDGRLKDKGEAPKYGPSKVGNLFSARQYASRTPQNGNRALVLQPWKSSDKVAQGRGRAGH